MDFAWLSAMAWLGEKGSARLPGFARALQGALSIALAYYGLIFLREAFT